MPWIQEGSGLTWGDFQDLRWRNTDTGEISYTEPAGYSQAVADAYYKYVAQGYDPQTASALAHGEVHGFTDMQSGLDRLTPTSSSIASGINPETGQRQTLGVTGSHDPITSNERFNTAVLSILGGALGGAALGGAGAAGTTAATEGTVGGAAAAEGVTAGGAAGTAGTAGISGGGGGFFSGVGGGALGAGGAAAATGLSSAGDAANPYGDTSWPDDSQVTPVEGGSPGPTTTPNTAGVGGAGAATAGSALARVLDGTASTADWLSVLGTGAATGLGVLGSVNQTNALKDLAAQQMAIGAPSRARYEASYSPDFKVTDIPGYSDALDTSWQSMLRKLSATGGNPFGNPGGLTEANKNIYSSVALPAIQNYRTQNANTGGYSSFNTAAPTTASNAIGSTSNIYNTVGAGIADVTRPQRPQINLSDLYRSLA